MHNIAKPRNMQLMSFIITLIRNFNDNIEFVGLFIYSFLDFFFGIEWSGVLLFSSLGLKIVALPESLLIHCKYIKHVKQM